MPYNDMTGDANQITPSELIQVLEEYRSFYGDKPICIEPEPMTLAHGFRIDAYSDRLLFAVHHPEEDE